MSTTQSSNVRAPKSLQADALPIAYSFEANDENFPTNELRLAMAAICFGLASSIIQVSPGPSGILPPAYQAAYVILAFGAICHIPHHLFMSEAILCTALVCMAYVTLSITGFGVLCGVLCVAPLRRLPYIQHEWVDRGRRFVKRIKNRILRQDET